MRLDPSEQFAIPFVKAIVLSEDGSSFWLQRRTKAGDPYDGYWELPGGKMRRGETAEATLEREVNEEAGLRLLEVLGQNSLELTDRFGRTARLISPLITVEVVSGPWPFLGHYFVCRTAGEPNPTDEGEAHRLLTPERFREEFLDPAAPGLCTTLDLLAMRVILAEGRLEPFLLPRRS
jgi:8-oxo-dGTP pyrophosphatase MutT (NUDIX family)